jgi:hypothetical protein
MRPLELLNRPAGPKSFEAPDVRRCRLAQPVSKKMSTHLSRDLFLPVGIEVARALDQIFVDAPRRDFGSLTSAFESFAAEFARKDAEFSLEVRRRTAERILMAAIGKRLPLADCRRYLSAVVRLGFTDLLGECTIRVIYCKYLIERGAPTGAARMLKSLSRKCALARGPQRTEMAADRKLIRGLLEQCDGA